MQRLGPNSAEENENHGLLTLITGASSGIGLAYARHFAKRNHRLLLVAKDKQRLELASESLGDISKTPITSDLRTRQSVNDLCDRIETPQIVIANAGVTQHGPVGQFSAQDRDQLYYLLCGGVIDLLENLVPRMLSEKGGRIVIVSSIAALTPMRKSSIYASAKAAVARYGDSLAEELKSTNVSLTVSLPGYVRTNAHARAGLHHLSKQIPNWMWLTPEQMVLESERAALKGHPTVIPGRVYRWVRPFLGSPLANRIWSTLSRRKPAT